MPSSQSATAAPVMPAPRPIAIPTRYIPPPAPESAGSPPPNKQALKTWWKNFIKSPEGGRLDAVVAEPTGIFGVPLRSSIAYANVAISLTDLEGKSYIYGYVPIIVAKCGVYLKEKATNVEGIFRLSGSEKRIKDLRIIFDTPPKYGKGLVWDGYTVHDAANVLRRYLNQLPEPVVPLDLYEQFRAPLRGHAYAAANDSEAPSTQGNFDLEGTIAIYKELIIKLPPLNIQLLLYILDLLAVFASKAEENRMTSQNLAAIFQPGLLSHPQHDMAPAEYRLSQDVLVFLIENQDNFLIGMRGTAADEKTVQDVQNGTPPPSTPSTPNPNRSKPSFGRSGSNASAGADSVRRSGGLRRNVSVNSHHSRQSNGAPSPASPAGLGSPLGATSGNGVHRSNTVPSKKSPALPSGRLQRPDTRSPFVSAFAAAADSSVNSPSPPGSTPPIPEASTLQHSPQSSPGFPPSEGSDNRVLSIAAITTPSHERLLDTSDTAYSRNDSTPSKEPSKEPRFPNLFNRSPKDSDANDRRPNKLRKKRIPGTANESAHSSMNSLQDEDEIVSAPRTVLETIPSENPIVQHTDASPRGESPPRLGAAFIRPDASHHSSDGTLKPGDLKTQPSASSLRSADPSATDQSDLEFADDTLVMAERQEKKRRWRLSRKRNDSIPSVAGSGTMSHSGYLSSPKKASGKESTNSLAGGSAIGKPRKSFTTETSGSGGSEGATEKSEKVGNIDKDAVLKDVVGRDHAGKESTSGGKEEKKGPLGWLKDKMRESEEKKRIREAERDAAIVAGGASDKHSEVKASLRDRRSGDQPAAGAASDAGLFTDAVASETPSTSAGVIEGIPPSTISTIANSSHVGTTPVLGTPLEAVHEDERVEPVGGHIVELADTSIHPTEAPIVQPGKPEPEHNTGRLADTKGTDLGITPQAPENVPTVAHTTDEASAVQSQRML